MFHGAGVLASTRESRKRAKTLAFFSVKRGQTHSVPTSEPLTFHEEPIKK